MPQKNQSLEGLRGIAAFTVMLSHVMFIFFPYVMRNLYPGIQKEFVQKFWFENFLSHPVFNILYSGHFAVCVFFVLSGCVLISGFHQSGDPNIIHGRAMRRYARLVIPIFCATMISVLLLRFGFVCNQEVFKLTQSEWVLMAYSGASTSLKSAAFSGLFGTLLQGDSAYDGPFWTMRPELIGSFLLFASYSIFGNKRKWAVCVSFALVALLSFQITFAVLYLAFLAGSFLTADFVLKNTNPIASLVAIAIGLYLGSFDYSSSHAVLNEINLPSFGFLHVDFNADRKTFFNVIGAFLLVYGVMNLKVVSSLLSAPIFVYLGRLSFPIYLLHMPILCTLTSRLFIFFAAHYEYLTSVVLALVVTAPAIIIVSDLFSRFVDIPATKISSYMCKGEKRMSVNQVQSEFKS